MERILVGVDGSPSSRRALKWAATEARLRGATLKVVTAWEIPSLVLMAPNVPGSLAPDLEKGATELVSSLVDELGADGEGLRIEQAAIEGYPAQVLVDLAEEEETELLVVGSRGRGGFRELLLGSVSHHCAHHARCPVTIVR